MGKTGGFHDFGENPALSRNCNPSRVSRDTLENKRISFVKGWIAGFLLQLQFLTRIPIPRKIKFSEDLLLKGFILTPLVGLVIGLILGGGFWLADLGRQRVISVLFIVVLEVLISGGLHLDGFADTCDGFYSNRARDKIREIMKDPRLGVFGAVGLILLLPGKAALLFVLPAEHCYRLAIIMPVISRLNGVWLAGVSHYAGKQKGLGTIFTENTGPRQVLAATLLTAVPCFFLGGPLLIGPFLITLGYTLYFSRVCRKKIGGITGDTIGHCIETTELLFLAALFVQSTLIAAGGGV